MKPNSEPEPFAETTDDNPFASFLGVGHFVQRIVFPIVAMNSEQCVSIGTGFFIHSEGLAMTAAHVLHEMKAIMGEASKLSDWSVFALLVHNEIEISADACISLMPVTFCWMPEGLDIGLFWASPLGHAKSRDRLEIGGLNLDLRLPKLGEKVVALGYHKMEGFVGKNGEIKINFDSCVSMGLIKNIYPHMRDRGMLSFPCFETTARFDPGMSGGPVFGEDGKVCGIVCSGMQGCINGLFTSHASLLWPLPAVSAFERDGRPSETHPHLLDLIEGGILKWPGKEVVQIEFKADGTRQIAYIEPRN